MPKRVKPLDDLKCRNARYGTEPDENGEPPKNELRDGYGLSLKLTPGGSKMWRFAYKRPGSRKENTISFGAYPTVSLAMAREEREKARKLLAQDLDPAVARTADRAKQANQAENTFRVVAEQWIETHKPTWSPGYLKKTQQLFARDLYPALGALPVAGITSGMLLRTIRKIEERGAYEMPRRALVAAGEVCRQAIGMDLLENDPSAGLVGLLKARPPVKHYAHVKAAQLPNLLKRIDAYTGRPETIAAVKLAVLTFIRGGELRFAEWSEFDFELREWHVPPGRMKGSVWSKLDGEPHIVPLARQTIALLEDLRQHTGRYRLLFPGMVDPNRPLTGEAMNKVFHVIGFKGQQTVHGLRGLATTLLNESRLFDKDIIDAQLAHKLKDRVQAAYNHATYMAERARIMQWWADNIDQKSGANVVPLAREA
ncbi:tyrosine-type recombinase/integrase [Cupriavidus metallidurans]|uniref:tyrosine-type recombinase/integrase n=1 Tax=Cupriavidus metallidurans TaxID=119219 RepID=UPI000CE0482F|nr:integrase arm-type DNA-binding domain-containing protein [Cupriavidus metallidurans]AVA36300.1 integrase [Cupriavidus metallidurans]